MKILSTIFYTVFIALVVGIAGLLLGTMLPIPGNIEIKIVKSGSMEPAISTGSLVVVKPAPMYRKGDVVTFGEDTKTSIPTTHRIIEVKPDGSFVTKGDANPIREPQAASNGAGEVLFVTKGDANEEADPNPVARRDIIGKVVVSIPGAGFVLDFARTKLGFALLIGIPAGLVILEEILTITRETQKWYRGRRGRRDGGGGMAGEDRDVLDLRTHLKSVYAKRYAMDEIKVAMFVEPRWYEAKWWRKRLGLDTDAYHTSTSLTVGLVFFAMMFAGHSGGTISYFSDIETSLANLLQAGEWEEELPPEPIVETDELLTPFAAKMVDEGEGEVAGASTEEGTPEEVPDDTPSADEPADPDAPPADPPVDDPAPVEPPADEPAADEPAEPEPTPEPPPTDPEPTPEPPAEETIVEQP